MQMTGAEAIVRCLESAGVTHALGIAGHTILSLLEALQQAPAAPGVERL